MLPESSNGTVYLLTNPAMPGLVKIGKTDREDTAKRIKELYTTGVPVPFECYLAVRVNDATKIEAALHQAFAPNRINSSREFFEIEPNQAGAILRAICLEDVTPGILKAEETQIEQSDIQAGKRLRERRPNLNFIEMNVPIGSILHSTRSIDTVQVLTDRTILFRGEEMSLTRATRIMLNRDYDIQPGSYWSYEGTRISELYELTYGIEAT